MSEISAISKALRHGKHVSYATMSAILVLVKGSHAQTANMTSRVVARRNGVVRYYIGTNEAQLSIVWCAAIFGGIVQRPCNGG